MIKSALLSLWWVFFVQGPLVIINAFSKVLNYLTGGVITDLLFGSHQNFSFSNIPMQFWWFVIVAISIWAVFFAIQLLVIQFREETQIKIKLILAFTNGAKGFAFMFLIPIVFFLMNFIIQGFANLIINNFGSNNNITQYLWHIGDSSWDGTVNGVPSNFGEPNNINSYNVIIQTFGTWFMAIGLFMVGLLLTQKVIELFLLFCISPLVMIGMTLDEGKAANTWKEMVIGKFLASTATLIGYFIFISALQAIIHNGTPSLATGDFTKQLFLLLFICAGALAMLSFADIAAQLAGEAVGIREGFSSFKSTFAGMRMVMGAAKMTGRALGFAKGKGALSAGAGQLGAFSQAATGAGDALGGSQVNEPMFNAGSFKSATTGMASRSGIVGLTGAGLNLGARGLGYAAAGMKKSWKAGNRSTFGGKVRGVGRIIGKGATAPITGIGKAVKSGFQTQYDVGKQQVSNAHNSKLKKHRDYLEKKTTKYKIKQESSKTKGKSKRKQEKHFKKTEKFKTQQYRQGYTFNDTTTKTKKNDNKPK